MTFTGNPQNIIISNHLSDIMTGGTFFLMMVAPSIASMIVTSLYLNSRRIAIISHLQRETEWASANSSISISAHSIASSVIDSVDIVTIMGMVDTEEGEVRNESCGNSPDFIAPISEKNIFEFAEFPEIAFLGLLLLIALEFQGSFYHLLFCRV